MQCRNLTRIADGERREGMILCLDRRKGAAGRTRGVCDIEKAVWRCRVSCATPSSGNAHPCLVGAVPGPGDGQPGVNIMADSSCELGPRSAIGLALSHAAQRCDLLMLRSGVLFFVEVLPFVAIESKS
jgi:hypothetical protein